MPDRNRLFQLCSKCEKAYRTKYFIRRDGSVLYRVPWKWIAIRPPKKVNYTEEQRKEIAERLKNSLKRNEK